LLFEASQRIAAQRIAAQRSASQRIAAPDLKEKIEHGNSSPRDITRDPKPPKPQQTTTLEKTVQSFNEMLKDL
jgi:hypothetical protein